MHEPGGLNDLVGYKSRSRTRQSLIFITPLLLLIYTLMIMKITPVLLSVCAVLFAGVKADNVEGPFALYTKSDDPK